MFATVLDNGALCVSFVMPATLEQDWYQVCYDRQMTDIGRHTDQRLNDGFNAVYAKYHTVDALATVGLALRRKIAIREQAQAAASADWLKAHPLN